MPGIVRKIDPQRRLVLPQEAIYGAGFRPGDLVLIWSEIDVDGLPCIKMTKHVSGCYLCGSTDAQRGYVTYKDRRLCKVCVEAAMNLDFKKGGSK